MAADQTEGDSPKRQGRIAGRGSNRINNFAFVCELGAYTSGESKKSDGVELMDHWEGKQNGDFTPGIWNCQSSPETRGEMVLVGESIQSVPETSRDDRGRFISGNSGGGRPIGAKNKLTRKFLEIVTADFIEFGAQALAKLREDDLVGYFRIVASVLSRDVIAKHESSPDLDYAELNDEELNELMKREIRRARAEKYLENATKMGRGGD